MFPRYTREQLREFGRQGAAKTNAKRAAAKADPEGAWKAQVKTAVKWAAMHRPKDRAPNALAETLLDLKTTNAAAFMRILVPLLGGNGQAASEPAEAQGEGDQDGARRQLDEWLAAMTEDAQKLARATLTPPAQATVAEPPRQDEPEPPRPQELHLRPAEATAPEAKQQPPEVESVVCNQCKAVTPPWTPGCPSCMIRQRDAVQVRPRRVPRSASPR
jgi:hypothetical protein